MKNFPSHLPCIAACYVDEEKSVNDLTHFWQQYFVETPLCQYTNCIEVAYVVDPFFPYIDDRNRCGKHTNQSELTKLMGLLH